jgi:serine/threonine-protein kinase
VPGYEILSELGRGGMGVVYKARQVAAKRIVALKMVLAGPHAGLLELQRFGTEAEAAARMQHANLVHIYEVGERDGLPYFSMEMVDGGSLAGKLTGQPWPEEQAARLIETLARAMDYAHRQGVIHRDLKPANVLLAADGTPKITDFGLAKKVEELGRGQTRTGTVMGTPSYMAPEQAGGKTQEIGPATDVWALGAILYELLTGRPPFRGATDLDTVLAVLSDDPVPVRQLNRKASRNLETICLKCLRKDPRKRYDSAAELADDLQRFVTGEPIKARPPRMLERAAQWVWRWPVPAGIFVFTTLLLTPCLFPPNITLLWVALGAAMILLWSLPRGWILAAVITALWVGFAVGTACAMYATYGSGGMNPNNRAYPGLNWLFGLYSITLLFLPGVGLGGCLGASARFSKWLLN